MSEQKTWRDVLADYRYLRATLNALVQPDRQLSIEELVDSALNHDTMHGDTAMVILAQFELDAERERADTAEKELTNSGFQWLDEEQRLTIALQQERQARQQEHARAAEAEHYLAEERKERIAVEAFAQHEYLRLEAKITTADEARQQAEGERDSAKRVMVTKAQECARWQTAAGDAEARLADAVGLLRRYNMTGATVTLDDDVCAFLDRVDASAEAPAD